MKPFRETKINGKWSFSYISLQCILYSITNLTIWNICCTCTFERFTNYKKGLEYYHGLRSYQLLGRSIMNEIFCFSKFVCIIDLLIFLTLNYPKFSFHIHAINNIKLTQDLKGRVPLLSFFKAGSAILIFRYLANAPGRWWKQICC